MNDPKDEGGGGGGPGRERWKEAAREAAKIVGVGAVKIVSRTAAWGFFGLVMAGAAFSVLLAAGLLDLRTSWSAWLTWGLLPVYLAAGAGLLGYAGLWRGIGRTLIYVGIERGWAASVVERVLGATVDILRRSGPMQGVLDRGDKLLRNVPLQNAEDALKRAIGAYAREDDLEGDARVFRRSVTRAVKGALARRVEKYLLAVVRAERTADGGGGVAMDRVIAVAPQQAQKAIGKMIRGTMRKQLLLMTAIALLVFALPPVVIVLVRTWALPGAGPGG